MSFFRPSFRRGVVVPLALMVAAMILVAIVLLMAIAHRQTADARADERALAESMLTVRLAEIEKLARDYGYWDEAFDNLVRRMDSSWADANIGPGLSASHGIDFSFVIDGTGRTIFGSVDGRQTDVPATQALKGGVEALLAARSFAGPDASVSGILVADGRPVLASVAPLRPFAQDDPAPREPRHVLLFADRLDEPQLARLAATFRLQDLHVATPDKAPDETSIGIRTFDDKASARLAWDGADPGGAMLRDLLPATIAIFVAFAAFAGFVLRQAERTARSLEISERRASQDVLTGLRNRSALLDHLDPVADAWPALGRGYALLYVDLDGFKQVNDTLGHGIGDEVLRIAARRLERAVPSEARVYRLGGDEFAVVLPGNRPPADIRRIGRGIVDGLSEPLAIGGAPVRIGATIGVTVAAGPADTLDLLRQADQALYLGKRTGKGTVRFFVEVTEAESRVS